MPKTLLEAGFLMVNFNSLTSTAAPATEEETTAAAEETPVAAATDAEATATETASETTDSLEVLPDDIKDWGTLLKDRKKKNKEKNAEEQLTDIDLETAFFKDFYTHNWEADVAGKLLAIGPNLNKAIKVLGFDPKRNPILGFILQPFTASLLKADQLNASTFKAIYQAVATHLVADSEFFKVNDYNIIYCEDLYTKSSATMVEYLKLQQRVLPADVKNYDEVKHKLRNRRAFVDIKLESNELNPTLRAKEILELAEDKVPKINGAKLNEIKIVEAILGKATEQTVDVSTKEQQTIVSKLDSAAKKFAALQAISLHSRSKAATEALSTFDTTGLDVQKVAQATKWLTLNDVLPKGQLSVSSADALVGAILASAK